FVFFFFQAEDGIRDFHVTGVQTCALPIYVVTREAVYRVRVLRAGTRVVASGKNGRRRAEIESIEGRAAVEIKGVVTRAGKDAPRSEERRVGKECRSRWSADD